MELCLTGKHISASEASSFGLVSRVVPDTEGQEKGQGVVEEAIKVAEEIASKGALAVRAVKDAVNAGASPPIPNPVTFSTLSHAIGRGKSLTRSLGGVL